MEWLKLFTLLVAVASIPIKADGPKKKIRIHLPQKVKHIHHHKKIYITNHPAPTQYAPTYIPHAEGTVAVPTSVALPAIVPINSVNLYDGPPSRLPTISPAASQLLPLYHTRGYYGPTPSDIDESEEDDESENVEYVPQSHYTHPLAHQTKRLKVIKLNEQPRKKIIRKIKPKRVVIRNKPLPAPADGEHPVSSFHEQFYSDVDGSAMIRKIKKTPRVEKIVDGDTEHIHTYSEEHIHKMVVNDPKLNNVVGVDHFNGIPVISNSQHIIPLKSGHQLLAVASSPFRGLTPLGSVNNPTNFEYASYNPREVTHDHIFHDHGVIPADVDVNKEMLGLPPKVSYDSHGSRVTSNKRQKEKNYQKSKIALKPSTNDFSYYEGIYSLPNGLNKLQIPTLSGSSFDTPDDGNYEEYRNVPEYGFKESIKKSRDPFPSYHNKNEFNVKPSNSPAPFSVSSTVVHEYKPKRYSGSSPQNGGLTRSRDPFANFKDSYSNKFEYDTYASSSNIYTSEDKNDFDVSSQNTKGKKKSISTQNISFGGKDQVSFVDHIRDGSFMDSLDSDGPTALENVELYDFKKSDMVTPTSFVLKESLPSHQYYSRMASKALSADPMFSPAASNDNYQFVEAPSVSTTADPSTESTSTPNQFNTKSTQDSHKESSKVLSTTKSNKNKESVSQYVLKEIQRNRDSNTRMLQNQESLLTTRNLKYGDKI